MMFKSIDILIGLSVIMLVASMAVTMITQAIIAVSGSRGRNLLAGLVGMIEQLDPGFSKRHAQEIVKMILTHQAVNGGTSFGIVRYGDVIHREELTKILLELASKAETPDQKITKIQQQALRALKNTMAANGIVNPEQTLDNVRLFALQLEKSSPEMASNVRHNIALMRYAPSQFLAKINSRFDSIIDRVSDRFTFNARILAFLSATLVAVALQLDTIMLVNRLAMDESTRTAIVQAAIDEVQSKENNNLAENPSGQSAATAPESVKVLYRSLANEGILVVPKIGEWSDSWKNVNPAGVFLSILLLSLGAPFWYGALGKLLQLRSLLARKDDVERVLRQSTQEAGKSATPVAQSMPPMPSNKSATAAAPSSPTDSTALTAAKAAVNAAKVAESKAQSAMTAIDEINVKLDQLLKKKSD